jgi:RNA polymerase sigma-70 factor (ECF subfamily)
MAVPNDTTLAVFMAHRAELIRYAAGIVGCRARAEDVVQEAYIRFDDMAGRRELGEPVGYLYRVVRNLALDWARRLKLERRHAGEEIAALAEAQPTPEDEALHRDRVRLVLAALDELPERTRRAIELYRVEGLKLREVADILGISIASAHALIQQGLIHCRQRLRSAE